MYINEISLIYLLNFFSVNHIFLKILEYKTISRFIWMIFPVAATKQTRKDSKPVLFVFTREQPTLNGCEKI